MNKKFLLILLAGLFFLAGCDSTPDLSNMSAEEKETLYAQYDQVLTSDQSKPIASYDFMTPLKDKTHFDQVVEEADNSTLIYFGFDECPYCRAFTPKLNVLESLYPEDIYFINTNEWHQNHPEDMDDIKEKYALETVPFLIRVDNEGNILKAANAGSSMEDIEDVLSKGE